MKSLIVSIIVLAVIISGVSVNSHFISKTYSEMEEALEIFPEHSSSNASFGEADNAYRQITGKMPYLYFVLPRDTVEKFYENLTMMYSYLHSDDSPSYRATLLVAKEAVKTLRKHEKLLP